MGRRRRESRKKAELVAVVDLGSAAVRLLLARIAPSKRFRVLVQSRRA
jgi:exopolyphosphatase/pppGpp-phosphohydrolase